MGTSGVEEYPYFVIAYANEDSLRALIKREGLLPSARSVGYVIDAADALAYAHYKKVLHRDIKPDNLLLHNGILWVADFGIARTAHSLDTTGLLSLPDGAGTLPYMPPEQVKGNPRIPSDVYALGMVAYELLTTRRPRSAATDVEFYLADEHDRPLTIEETRRRVGKAMDDVAAAHEPLVMRTLQKDARLRPQTMEEVRDILKETQARVEEKQREHKSIINMGTVVVEAKPQQPGVDTEAATRVFKPKLIPDEIRHQLNHALTTFETEVRVGQYDKNSREILDRINIDIFQSRLDTALQLGQYSDICEAMKDFQHNISVEHSNGNSKSSGQWYKYHHQRLANSGEQLFYEIGLYFHKIHEYAEAIKVYEFVETIIKSNDRVRSRMAQNLGSRYQKTFGSNYEPRKSKILCAKAGAMIQLGDIEDALRTYEEAMKYIPVGTNSPQYNSFYFDAYIQKGNLFHRLTRFHEAMDTYKRGTDAFRELLSLYPDEVSQQESQSASLLYIKIGTMLLYDPHTYDEALQAFDDAIKIDPKNTSAWKGKAELLTKLGRLTEAKAALKNA